MIESLGEKLTELQVGDSLIITVSGEHYTGEVVEINRQKCDLVSGFMEDGYIGVYMKLTSQTIEEQNLSVNHILIAATEKVPNDFEPPTASVYDLNSEDSVTSLGKIQDIR